MVAEDPPSAALFRPLAGGDRLRFDLKGYVLRRLARAGVAERYALAEDTFATRRASSARGARGGAAASASACMLSAIALVD